VPELVLLYPNYPNPFNPQTTVSFYLPSSSGITLSVYNTAGQRVATLVDGHQRAGYHRCVWNGTDQQGQEVASGVYLCRLKAGDEYKTRKMTLLR
jgi:flagellar hook assembly protein FlgD